MLIYKDLLDPTVGFLRSDFNMNVATIVTQAFLTHMPSMLLYSFVNSLYTSQASDEPRSHAEAITRAENASWMAAERIEIQQL